MGASLSWAGAGSERLGGDTQAANLNDYSTWRWPASIFKFRFMQGDRQHLGESDAAVLFVIMSLKLRAALSSARAAQMQLQAATARQEQQ